MLYNNVIINIPIYRCTEEEFSEEKDKEREQLHQYFSSCVPPQAKDYDVTPLVESSMQRNARGWHFNEIIGYISIFIFGDQIRGNRWYVQQERIRKNINKKNINYEGKEFEMSTSYMKTNKEIFEKIIKILESLPKKNKILKNRYIDLSELKSLGLYIDWKGLIASNKQLNIV